MSDTKPTHYKGFTIKHNAPMTDEYYVVGSLSFYKTVDDAKRSIDGLLGNDTPTSLDRILKDYATAIVDNCLAIMDDPAADFRKPHDAAHAEAIAAITALVPEKRDTSLWGNNPNRNKYSLYKEAHGFNQAINTIQRNFTGQTDNERKQP